ncbi:UPF0481 protein At3g47200-like [Pyrus x bretschneideri]|uniref:UPF0481 protein At3g47200-like n=1 Tax=Pyrus x bretschneideri TaxID=225117 RepID=UPI00202FA6B2|nr:UPF0481 protein At3g47200-like [Pyrus x bretschneideri]
MEENMEATPQIDHIKPAECRHDSEAIANGGPCIHRIPNKLRKVNEAAYTPQLLSIGPFHHGNPKLLDMEGHKKRHYENFLRRCSKSEATLTSFIEARQKNILQCYAGAIELATFNIVDVILVDACFIIELFLANFEKIQNEYLFGSPWLRKAVEQDLILFENQLPYSVLLELYDFANPASSISIPREEQAQKVDEVCSRHLGDSGAIGVLEAPSVDNFLELTCQFFKDHSKGKSVRKGVQPKHFTDLVRYFLSPDETMTWRDDSSRTPIKNIYNIRQLTASGVKFVPILEDPSYVIRDETNKVKFHLGTGHMDLKITQFCVKYETECIVRNVMALEQFVYPFNTCICNYFLLMDQLVDIMEDVDLLVKNKVIVNLLGSNEAVTKLINGLCVNIMEEQSCRYADICRQLNEHYENRWNRTLATMRQVYFRDLWTASSTLVALLILFFTTFGFIKSIRDGI